MSSVSSSSKETHISHEKSKKASPANSFKLLDTESEKINIDEITHLINHQSIDTTNNEIFEFIKKQNKVFKDLQDKPLIEWVIRYYY